ncbi:hypothetical protein E1262_27265 [Jiangella aurantiaca]|uniref:DUF4913 domain-containing protein n=1 Tax=Jiangella aurantiaca TaxID=2530373 RepID=A0A4R5A1I3_9ACTN|nr:hypothetical protein [Jiangella aurantiaca]TDD64790.1 hypothetical protein E1262_27265 [Jiangella aurantiaca]
MSTRRVPEGQQADADAAPVRALARQVQQLAAGVAELTARTGRAEETATQAAKAVTTISEAVRDLYDRQDSGTGDDGTAGVTPPWWLVRDPDQAAAILTDLTDWVSAVYVRYLHETDLSGCWPYHPDVVTELAALRDGWEAAYNGKHASPAAVLDWHDRWRPGTVQRVTEMLRRCSLDQHADGKGWLPVERPGGEAVDDAAAWWASTGGAETPPAPSREAAKAEQDRRRARDKARY